MDPSTATGNELMPTTEQEAQDYFHAYGTEMYYAHNMKRCWWGDRTRDQDAEWHRRLAIWQSFD